MKQRKGTQREEGGGGRGKRMRLMAQNPPSLIIVNVISFAIFDELSPPQSTLTTNYNYDACPLIHPMHLALSSLSRSHLLSLSLSLSSLPLFDG